MDRTFSVICLLTLLAALLVATPPAEAQTGRAFRIADNYRLKIPGSASLSPDGRQLAYHLSSWDLPQGKNNRDIYLVDLESHVSRRLTTTIEQIESTPVFSPDGKHLVFAADRGSGNQLWLLPLAGGEARALTDISTGVADPVWTPDGKWIAFTSKVYPECGANDLCNLRNLERREAIPLQVHVADELLYRHWNAWADGRVAHVLMVEVEGGRLRDMTPGLREAPAHFGGHAVAFSPDGTELAYTRNPDPVDELAWSTNTDIWLVPVAPDAAGETQAARNITAENLAFDGHPAYSPDGRFLAYLRHATPHFEADRPRLVIYDRKSGEHREITHDFDYQVRDIEWAPDSAGLFFTAQYQARSPLFYVPVGGGVPQMRVDSATLHEFHVSPDGNQVWAVRSAIDSPREVWRVDPNGEQSPMRVTNHNLFLEQEVDLRPGKSLTIPGAGGKPVQVWLVTPHGFDPKKKYPLVFNVHGGPQYQWEDSYRGDWQVYPGAGYVLAFPNPHGSTGFGQDYTNAISGGWAGLVYEDLLAVSDHLAGLAYVDEERMGVMGWSWGGYMVNWMIGHTDRFQAAASMMGIYDLASFWASTEELWFPEWDLAGLPWTSQDYTRFNPAGAAEAIGRFRIPTLIITGEKDFRIPYTQSLQLFTVLRRQKVPAKLVVFPEAGHWPGWYEMALYYTAHLEWFHQHLGGEAPPWSVRAFAAGEVFP